MSHNVTVKSELKDVNAIKAAVEKVQGAKFLGVGNHELYGGKTKGVGVQLPNWRYPIVVNQDTGEVTFDNYHGSWGNQDIMDGFSQRYALEKTKIEAWAQNYVVGEEVLLEDGTIALDIEVPEYA